MRNLYTNVSVIRQLLFGQESQADCPLALNCPPQGPKFMMLKVSNYCNSACAYCLHGLAAREEKSKIDGHFIRDAIRQARELGVEAITFTGGGLAKV